MLVLLSLACPLIFCQRFQEKRSPGALSSRVLFALRAGSGARLSRGLQQHSPLPPEELRPYNGPPTEKTKSKEFGSSSEFGGGVCRRIFDTKPPPATSGCHSRPDFPPIPRPAALPFLAPPRPGPRPAAPGRRRADPRARPLAAWIPSLSPRRPPAAPPALPGCYPAPSFVPEVGQTKARRGAYLAGRRRGTAPAVVLLDLGGAGGGMARESGWLSAAASFGPCGAERFTEASI